MWVLALRRCGALLTAIASGVVLGAYSAPEPCQPAQDDFSAAGPVVPSNVRGVESEVERGTVRAYYGPTNHEKSPCRCGTLISGGGHDSAGWQATCGPFTDIGADVPGDFVQRFQTRAAVPTAVGDKLVAGVLDIPPSNPDDPPGV